MFLGLPEKQSELKKWQNLYVELSILLQNLWKQEGMPAFLIFKKIKQEINEVNYLPMVMTLFKIVINNFWSISQAFWKSNSAWYVNILSMLGTIQYFLKEREMTHFYLQCKFYKVVLERTFVH
jgi:hypothetical protein